MKYIEGTPREQLCLFQNKLDDIIPEDHLIRFIDTYVDKLDLVQLEVVHLDKSRGTPGYDPRLYLKIYIYSYLNKVRSSRKIERECKRNLELIWLAKQLSPDHWSISNFRKINKKALTNIFKEFLRFCHQLELLSFECIGIDGTKMRGQNGLSNVYHKNNIDQLLEKVEKKIKDYLEELEGNDKKEEDEYEFLKKNIPDKLKQIKKHKEKLNFVKEIFKTNPDIERYFANDPESNFQKDNGRCIVGYNGQSAVDEKKKIIISTNVTNENTDLHQLCSMKNEIDKTKKELGIDKKTVCVADAGYHSETEILNVINDEKIDLFIPHPRDVKTKEKLRTKRGKDNKTDSKGFEREDFKYDAEKDIFICPNNKVLERTTNSWIKSGVKRIKYQCKDCGGCKDKQACTTNKQGRSISASENIVKMEKFRKKVKTEIGKRIVNKRKEIVEHPFGTIKRNFGYRYFMMRGIESAKSEFNFIAFVYNFKRVINIVGVKKLLEALN